MKKFAAMLVCIMLMAAMLCSSAMACSLKDKAMADLVADVNLANREIKSLVKIAQATPYDDVDWMQCKVSIIVNRVKAHARLIGAQVACEMESYYIDGRWVLVDPLMVVNIRQ